MPRLYLPMFSLDQLFLPFLVQERAKLYTKSHQNLLPLLFSSSSLVARSHFPSKAYIRFLYISVYTQFHSHPPFHSLHSSHGFLPIFTMQCHRPRTLSYSFPRPSPRFCIFRPSGTLAPLIPVDELPSWLQICNWSADMYKGLQPVSTSYIPREGEYDVICHHCSNSIDSLHQSVSERNTDSPRSPISSQARTCQTNVFFAPEVLAEPPVLDAKVLDPKMAFAPGFSFPQLGQPPFTATLQNPFPDGFTFSIPNMPGMTFNMVPVPGVPQMQSNAVHSSPPGSDHLPKEPPRAPTLPPRRPNLDGCDPGDSSSFIQLSALPPPAVPLEYKEIHPTTPAPCPSSKHPLSPDTQGRISQAIAASLCSVSVENENWPPACHPERACQRRPSVGQVSNSNIVRNIATSLGPSSVANGSVASSVEVIAAIDHLKEVIRIKETPRESTSPQSIVDGQDGEGPVPRSHSPASLSSSKRLCRASSKAKRRRTATERRRERALRRQERRKEKLESLYTQAPKVERERHKQGKLHRDESAEEIVVETKPEQVNSSTKRRDRREKMEAKGRKDDSSHSRYVHMVMASKSRSNVSCH